MSRKIVSYSDLDDPNQATLVNSQNSTSHDSKRQRRNPQSNRNAKNQNNPYSNGGSTSNNQNNGSGLNKNRKNKRGNPVGTAGGGARNTSHNSNPRKQNQNQNQNAHWNPNAQVGSGRDSKGKGRQVDPEVQNAIDGLGEAVNFSREVEMDQQEGEEYQQDETSYYPDLGEEQDIYDQEEYENQEEQGDSNADDPSLAEAGDAFLASINFFQPEQEEEEEEDDEEDNEIYLDQNLDSISNLNGMGGIGNGKSRVIGGSKPLTKSQVWDDSSLIKAWDAAVEEYQIFHSRRSKWRSDQTQSHGQLDVVDDQDDWEKMERKVDSPLWNDSPSIHSNANSKAKKILESEEMERKKAEKLKEAVRYGKESAAKVSNNLNQGLSNEDGNNTASSSSIQYGSSSSIDKEKGSRIGNPDNQLSSASPMKYSITKSLINSDQGNKAWKEACESISNSKPIRIGSELISTDPDSRLNPNSNANGFHSQPDVSQPQTSNSTSRGQSQNHPSSSASSTNTNTANPPAPPIPLVGDENLQNMIMAWYYAGYYTGVQQGLLQAEK